MAAAKKRPSPAPRFPYSARDREGGGAYAETANGRELLFTGPAGEAAKRMAQRRQAATLRPLDTENPYGTATPEPGRVLRPLGGENPYGAQPALDRANPYAPVEPSPLEEPAPQAAPQPAARPQRAPARAPAATAAASPRPAPQRSGETILASFGGEGPAVDPTFDAHAYQMAAEAANPFAMPRTARGSLRDLAPTDASPEEVPVTYDAAMSSAPSAATPTLAEVQESRAYAEGEAPGQQWDTIYRDPEEERRRKAKPAAKDEARVRHGSDVKFYDPEEPVYL